jgi:peptidoglycan hydrolase CwlO-like protein
MAETELDGRDIGTENYEELRNAIRHFDRVIRSQIVIQGRQGDRIKNSIRAGMLFLVLIGISIFIILYTMVTQVNQISEAVVRMDHSFDEVRVQMVKVDQLMTGMEKNVLYMDAVSSVMQNMDSEMGQMTRQMQQMQVEVDAMKNEVAVIRQQADVMTRTSGVMDQEIYRMNQDMNRLAAPARSMNKMFPMP